MPPGANKGQEALKESRVQEGARVPEAALVGLDVGVGPMFAMDIVNRRMTAVEV